METVRIRYNGAYAGTNPETGLTFQPGEERDVPLDKAEKLVESGQFEVLQDEEVGGE